MSPGKWHSACLRLIWGIHRNHRDYPVVHSGIVMIINKEEQWLQNNRGERLRGFFKKG
jgi:hypothetical protein